MINLLSWKPREMAIAPAVTAESSFTKLRRLMLPSLMRTFLVNASPPRASPPDRALW